MCKNKKSSWVEIAGLIVATIALGAAFLGGRIAYLEYENSARQEKEQRTFGFIQSFLSSPMHESRQNIEVAWDQAWPKIMALSKTKNLDQSQISLKYDMILEENIFENVKFEIVAVGNFLEQLYLCYENDHCDKDIIRRYFKGHVSIYWDRHQRFIKKIRKDTNDEKVGVLLEAFAKELKNIQ